MNTTLCDDGYTHTGLPTTLCMPVVIWISSRNFGNKLDYISVHSWCTFDRTVRFIETVWGHCFGHSLAIMTTRWPLAGYCWRSRWLSPDQTVILWREVCIFWFSLYELFLVSSDLRPAIINCTRQPGWFVLPFKSATGQPQDSSTALLLDCLYQLIADLMSSLHFVQLRT